MSTCFVHDTFKVSAIDQLMMTHLNDCQKDNKEAFQRQGIGIYTNNF